MGNRPQTQARARSGSLGRKYDVGLTEKGLQQAEKVARIMAGALPGVNEASAFYSSPLLRALQTAERLQKSLGTHAPIVPIKACW